MLESCTFVSETCIIPKYYSIKIYTHANLSVEMKTVDNGVEDSLMCYLDDPKATKGMDSIF